MKIKNQLISSRESTYSGTSKRTTVTVHETANTSAGAGAQAHANLQANNPRNASWHIQVDDTEAIRSYPDSVRCGHAGSKAKDSIAVEICVNSDGSRAGARANAAEVVAQLLKDNGLDEMNVVGHTYWTGKDCPHFILNEGRWDEFIDDVRGHLNGEAPSKKKESATASGGSSASGSSGSNPSDDNIHSDSKLDWRLDRAGYNKVSSITRRVAGYQSSQKYGGLVKDGIWGPVTEAHYQWTYELQQQLNRWKGSEIPVDGDYRSKTAGRVKNVQARNHGRAYKGRVDGIPGPVTCSMLGIPTHPNL